MTGVRPASRRRRPIAGVLPGSGRRNTSRPRFAQPSRNAPPPTHIARTTSRRVTSTSPAARPEATRRNAATPTHTDAAKIGTQSEHVQAVARRRRSPAGTSARPPGTAAARAAPRRARSGRRAPGGATAGAARGAFRSRAARRRRRSRRRAGGVAEVGDEERVDLAGCAPDHRLAHRDRRERHRRDQRVDDGRDGEGGGAGRQAGDGARGRPRAILGEAGGRAGPRPGPGAGASTGSACPPRCPVPLLIPSSRVGRPPHRTARYAFAAGAQPDRCLRSDTSGSDDRAVLDEALWEDGFPWPTTTGNKNQRRGGLPGFDMGGERRRFQPAERQPAPQPPDHLGRSCSAWSGSSCSRP